MELQTLLIFGLLAANESSDRSKASEDLVE